MEAPWVPVDYVSARARILGPGARPGAVLRRELALLTDRWAEQLFESSGAAGTGCALVAIGGYGRGELAPGSDLDLLLLHPEGVDVGGVAERIWYPIWDAGMRLDHSVRTPGEARDLAARDSRVILGLLDSRTVAGNADLLLAVRRWVFEDWRATAPRRLDEMRADVVARISRNGELAYLLEPDLKESFGGLRDVAVLRALEASWIIDARCSSLAGAIRTLLDVRDALHLVTGRSSDRLTLQEQGPVATLLGLADADELLRSVSAAGRSIGFASDAAWHQAERVVAARETGILGRRRKRQPQRIPLAHGVVVQDGEAVLAIDADPSGDPVLMLRAAASAAQAGLRLSQHALDRLAAESAPMPTPWPDEARQAIVSLLGAGESAIPVWEALDQANLIERLIPPWAEVRSAPQRNPVHLYTVDRHLVQTAVNAAGLSRRVSRPDLLLIAALLHDIGKGRGPDHTSIGVSIVGALAPTLGFDPSDTQVLTRLVEHHLLLPETATRRDLADPATARLVAAAVGDTQILDLLHALSRADAAATGPAAWSPWKASLIEGLVERTRAQLAGAPPVRPELSEQQLDLAGRTGVEVMIEEADGAYDVTVAVDDRVGLLAVIAGVLAIHRMHVLSAKTQTIGSRAVTTWVAGSEFGIAPEVEKLREDIRLALGGSLDVEAGLRRRSLAQPRRALAPLPPPRVETVPAASERFTVIEVRAHDSIGLLHSISRAISETGVTIDAARVSTLGSDAVDVFYLADESGEPLSQSRTDSVRRAVLDRLAYSDG